MRHFTLFLVPTLLLLTIAFLPTIHQFRASPPHQIFVGTHNNSLDYPMFVAAINRAQRGLWCNKAVFTSEPQPCDLVHWIYIPLGKLTSLFGLDGILTYQLGRLLFGLTLAYSTYYFISGIFRSSSAVWSTSLPSQIAQPNTSKYSHKIHASLTTHLTVTAFLLALFSAGFVRFATIKGHLEPVGTYLSWWTGGDVLRRALFQPHAMLKNTLLLLILGLFAHVFTLKQSAIPKRLILTISMLALLLGLHDPMNSLSILTLLGLYSLFQLLKHRLRLIPTIHHLPAKLLIIYTACSSLGLALTYWAFKYTPWISVSNWESHQFYPVPFWEYANHLGPVFYLGIPGLVLLSIEATRKKPHLPLNKFLVYSTTILTFSSLFMILSGITRHTGLSTLRFFQTPVHIFLAIGTTYLIFALARLILHAHQYLIHWLLIIVILAVTLPSYLLSYRSQLKEWSTYYWNMYPDRDSYQTLLYLKSISHPDDVVLSNDLSGQLIPTVSGNLVYIGHIVSTLNFGEKLAETRQFFSGKYNRDQSLTLIRKSRAKYLITTYPENQYINPTSLPFLTLLHDGPTLQLYQIDESRL